MKRPNFSPVQWLLLGVCVFLMGCNQQRYTPAQWRAAPRGATTADTGEMQTLPDSMQTLPGRMQTLPGRMQTLPGRMVTLPGRMQTLPNRNPTGLDRFGEITDWLDPNSRSHEFRGSTLPQGDWSTLPNRGTTLPRGARFPRGTTLP